MTGKILIWAKLPKNEGFINFYYGIDKIAHVFMKEYTVEKDALTGKFRIMINDGEALFYVDLIKDYDDKIIYANQYDRGKIKNGGK